MYQLTGTNFECSSSRFSLFFPENLFIPPIQENEVSTLHNVSSDHRHSEVITFDSSQGSLGSENHAST